MDLFISHNELSIVQDLLSITSTVIPVDMIILNKLKEYLAQHQDTAQIYISCIQIIQLLHYSNRNSLNLHHYGGFLLYISQDVHLL